MRTKRDWADGWGVVVGALLLGVLLGSTATPLRPLPAWARPGWGAGRAGHLARGTVDVIALPSSDRSGGLRRAWVYRPAVADSSRLPVVYFLHGLPGSAHDAFDTGIAATLDRAFSAGARPFVVVSPDGNGAARSDTEWADAVDGGDRLESFVIDTLIPAVEGANRRDAAHRAIVGFSMGGYGAANLALRHPDLFSQIVSLSGYFHVDDPDGVFEGVPAVVAANSPDRLAARARGMRVLLVEPDANDDDVSSGESARFAAILRRAGVRVTRLVVAGHHDYDFVAGQYPTLVAFLDQGWPRSPRE